MGVSLWNAKGVWHCPASASPRGVKGGVAHTTAHLRKLPRKGACSTHGSGLLVLTPTLGTRGFGQVRGPDLTPIVRQGTLCLCTLTATV